MVLTGRLSFSLVYNTFMKRFAIVFIFCFLVSNLFGSFNYDLRIDLNENSYVLISGQDYIIEELSIDAKELFWNLLTWGNGAKTETQNASKTLVYDIQHGKVIVSTYIGENKIEESEFVFRNYEELQENIFDSLNSMYNVNVEYKNVSSLQLYIIMETNGNDYISSDRIFLTESSGKKAIEGYTDYYLEQKLFTKTEYLKLIFMNL